MTLTQYLAENRLSASAFGRLIGCSGMAVSRYARGRRIPHGDLMRRIVAATQGQVQPNDFYQEAA